MTEEIYTVAAALAAPVEEEETLLRRFCQAEEETLLRREPALAQLCGETFVCAAGCLAAADLLDSRWSGEAEQFTVGDVSVKRGAAGDAAGRLREQAERMLAPYWGRESFAFLGVRG